MFKIRNILVTTDFSDYSAAALEAALSLAEAHQANVCLLHVVEDRTIVHLPASQHKTQALLEDAMAGARSGMQKFVYDNINELVCVRQVVLHGVPHEEIARYAREQRVDLIVIATHGRTGLAHALMGSIAEKIIRCSPVPVLAVKPEAVLERLITEEDVAGNLHFDDGR